MGAFHTMFCSPLLLGFLLVVVGDARSLVEDSDGEILMVDTAGAVVDRKMEVEEEDRVGGLVTGLAMTLITNMIRDQILNILGITTTKATPILDAIGGVLGITEATTTTTQAPCNEGGLLGFGLLAAPCTTTTTTTTTAAPTTTTTTTVPCGGILGFGLLGAPCTTVTTAAPTTTTTKAPCGGLFGGGLLGC